MEKSSIKPERITHPFQLMAAWFVMLISLDTIFLAGAYKIQTPIWAAGFLIVSTVIFSALVMIFVFLMLTIFRPHLQGPKEYAEWLKDERKYTYVSQESFKQVDPQVFVSNVGNARNDKIKKINKKISSGLLHSVSVSNLVGAELLVSTLRKLGFSASIYNHEPGGILSDRTDLHTAIWIGSRVPAKEAILATKTALGFWPHLCYLHLSDDDKKSAPPDYIHDQIYIGGATSTAKELNLIPWKKDELLAMNDDLGDEQYRGLIRAHYL